MVLQLAKWEVLYNDSSTDPIGIVLYTEQRQTASDAERACALHALIDSAAMVLVKKYATNLREWTASEESDLAKLQERQVISQTIQRACRNQELVIFQKRKREEDEDEDSADRAAQMPKITWRDEHSRAVNITSVPSADSDWELVGGILNFKRAGQPTMIFEETNVDIEDLLDLPEPGVAATSLNATGATLERRQLRHYMLDLAGSLQVHFDKDTLNATDNILARIKENDASSTRTLSIENERNTDWIEAMNSIHDVIFSATAPGTPIYPWEIKHATGEPISLEDDTETDFGIDGALLKLKRNPNFSITVDIIYTVAGTTKTEPIFTISNLDCDDPTVTIGTNQRLFTQYLRNFTFQPENPGTAELKTIFQRGTFRILAFKTLPTVKKTGRCPSTYSTKCYQPAMESHRNNHITVKTAQATAKVFTSNTKGVFGNEDIAKELKNGIELVPIHDSEIELLTAGEDIKTYHFHNALPGEESFSWVIGGCPTTLLDGAASAVAFLQHTLRSDSP